MSRYLDYDYGAGIIGSNIFSEDNLFPVFESWLTPGPYGAYACDMACMKDLGCNPTGRFITSVFSLSSILRDTASHIGMAHRYGEMTLSLSLAVYVLYKSFILLENSLIPTTPHSNINITRYTFQSDLYIPTNA